MSPEPNVNTCVAWRRIDLKLETAAYLAGNDTKAGKGIAGHNQFSKKQRCW